MAVALAILVHGLLAPQAEAAICGGEGQRRCEFANAKRVSKPGCPRGSFFDLIRGGSCWSCPSGYKRTVLPPVPVDATNACRRPTRTATAPASFQRKAGCPRGSFFDPRNNGECWACPRGYKRNALALAAVTARNACFKPPQTSFARAKFHKKTGCPRGSFFDLIRGGSCWSCPSGYGRTLARVDAKNACAKGILRKAVRAKFRGKWGCGKGTFLDPIRRGSCWSCPRGHKRYALSSVTANNACIRGGRKTVAAASLKGRAGCGRGSFLDPRNLGECWSCPRGHGRNPLAAVTAANACATKVGGEMAPAKFRNKFGCPKGSFFDPRNRGECWSCPARHNRTGYSVASAKACTIAAGLACASGLISVRGVCRRKGVCGGRNQRPCLLLYERAISCDRGLREDFGTNRCVILKPGESAFLAGLGSLTGEIAKGTQICEEALGIFPQLKTGIRAADLGASCHRNMTIGFVCAAPSAVQKITDTVELANKIGREYERSPCNSRLAPAPIRASCALVMALVRDADKAVNCLAAMIRTGLLPNAFRGQQKAMCLMAGEEAFLTTVDYLTGTINPKTQIGRIIKKIKKVNKRFEKASEANEFLNKVNALRECRGVIGGPATRTATYRPSPSVSRPAISPSAPAGSSGPPGGSGSGFVTPPAAPAYNPPPATAQPFPFPSQSGGSGFSEVAPAPRYAPPPQNAPPQSAPPPARVSALPSGDQPPASRRFRAVQALSVHEGPSPTAPAIAILQPGAEVEVTGRLGDWVSVVLGDGRTGYALGGLLERSGPSPAEGIFPREPEPGVAEERPLASERPADPGLAPPMPCIGGRTYTCCDDPEMTYHARCQEWQPKYERWRKAFDAYHQEG